MSRTLPLPASVAAAFDDVASHTSQVSDLYSAFPSPAEEGSTALAALADTLTPQAAAKLRTAVAFSIVSMYHSLLSSLFLSLLVPTAAPATHTKIVSSFFVCMSIKTAALRSSGTDPASHPISKDMKRLHMYMQKLRSPAPRSLLPSPLVSICLFSLSLSFVHCCSKTNSPRRR